MSKSVSFEGIKKILGKIKELLGKKADKTELNNCVRTYTQQNVNFNEVLGLGIYRLGDNNTNGPDFNFSYSNLFNIKDSQNNTLQQLVFPYLDNINKFSIRWGNNNKENNNFIGNHPWLYFHGSTSPNIPVLKKKMVSGTTNDVGGLSLGFKISDAIALAVYMNSCDKVTTAYPEVYNNYSSGSTTVGVRIINYNTNEVVSNTNVSLIVYYLEIPSGYQFPDTTPVSSDESLDNSELSPQQNLY